MTPRYIFDSAGTENDVVPVNRLYEFLATGVCGLVNIAGPTFGATPHNAPGYYFVVTGHRLAANLSKALHEAKDKSGEDGEVQSREEQGELFDKV